MTMRNNVEMKAADSDGRLAIYVRNFSRLLREDTTTIPPDATDTERFYRFQELLGEVFPQQAGKVADVGAESAVDI